MIGGESKFVIWGFHTGGRCRKENAFQNPYMATFFESFGAMSFPLDQEFFFLTKSFSS
jgi:hypothetical protein